MTSKNSDNNTKATDGLDDIMADVASQLSNDLYEIPQSGAMGKEVDSIDEKLADTADDINLDDDIINLLESDREFDLPTDGGLSYEEPRHVPANDFASALAAEERNLSDAKPEFQPPPQDPFEPQPGVSSEQDPLLLLEEELPENKSRKGGGILSKVALLLAIVVSGGAGYAVWQGLATNNQAQKLMGQLQENTPAEQPAVMESPVYDQKLGQLEKQLQSSSSKLGELEAQVGQHNQSLGQYQDQLNRILEELKAIGKQQEEPKDEQAFVAIENQLKTLQQALSALDERLTQGQKGLEAQQQQLGNDLEHRLKALAEAKAPAPSSNTASSTQAEPAQAAKTSSRVSVTIAPAQDSAPHQAPAQSPIQSQRETAKAETAKPVKANKARKLHQVSTLGHNQRSPVQKNETGPTGGPWAVNLVSTTSEQEARNLLARLKQQGIAAKVKIIIIKGAAWHRLYLDGFANATAATKYANSVRNKPGLGQAWVEKLD